MMSIAERCAKGAMRLAFIEEFKFYPSEEEFELIEQYRIDNGITRLPIAGTKDAIAPFFISYQGTELGSIHVRMVFGCNRSPVGFEATFTPPSNHLNKEFECIPYNGNTS